MPVARPPAVWPLPRGMPPWRGVLAGWNRGVGLRADPVHKGAGYLLLSTGYDLLVAQLSCRLRLVARPACAPYGGYPGRDWPAGQHCLCPLHAGYRRSE